MSPTLMDFFLRRGFVALSLSAVDGIIHSALPTTLRNPPAAECVPWASARGSAQRSAPPLQQSPRWRRYWTGAAWRKEGAARKKYTAAGNNRICSSHERSALPAHHATDHRWHRGRG